jgi:tetratricopeptide (TPR) repeat protein
MPTDRTAPRRAVAAAAVKLCLALLLVASAGAGPHALGRRQDDPERERAFKLWEAQNFVEAMPLLEKLAQKYPDDPSVLGRLGFSIYASSTSVKDPAKRKEMRDRSKQILLKSREAGDNSSLTALILDSLESGKDPTGDPFSHVRDAEKAMRDAEEAFVRGDLDKALAGYKHALELDPRLYEAALYAGDMYFKKGHVEKDARKKDGLMNEAGVWFAKAVAIDADRETAHRYWGDALMMGQGKRDESREHFVDAVVAEPYSRNAWVGLVQWGEKYAVRLAHPRVEVPKSPAEAAGDAVWGAYASTRAEWRARRFAETYPGERAYRHSLAEEAAALRALADAASKAGWSGQQLSPTLTNVIELNKAGLLEAFILIAMPDEGIEQDYAAYRKANRDKLRRYLLDYVSGGKN